MKIDPEVTIFYTSYCGCPKYQVEIEFMLAKIAKGKHFAKKELPIRLLQTNAIQESCYS